MTDYKHLLNQEPKEPLANKIVCLLGIVAFFLALCWLAPLAAVI